MGMVNHVSAVTYAAINACGVAMAFGMNKLLWLAEFIGSTRGIGVHLKPRPYAASA
jgi:hypothetical protein